MSWFSNIFGGKPDAPPEPAVAIQKIRETEELLMKKSDFLEKKIQDEIAQAKKHGTKNKRAALSALKRKHRLEKQLQQLDGTLSTIEYQREALENASTNTEVLTIMGLAAKSLKGAHKNMDVDKVHDLMDDIAEQQDVANEISEAISNPIGYSNDIDEDELARELEDLEQETIDEQMLDVQTPGTALPESSVNLPSVPATSLPVQKPKQKVAEDDEMKELEMWAS